MDSSLVPDAENEADAVGLSLVVRTDQDVRPISPKIYGVNPHSGHRCDDPELRYGVCRLGGNRWTAYNWENNLSNAGRDYCFQNDEHLGRPEEGPGFAATSILEPATRVGAAAMLTVPIVDHVAEVSTGGSGPPACSGDVRNVEDSLNALFAENFPESDDPEAAPDLDDDRVYQDQFVNHVRRAAGEIDGAQVLFSLDNEPDLWADTHPQVHPQRVSYADLVRRNVDYALAVKRHWPEAEVAGFVSYGYQGFISLQGAPDADEHGRFLDYYLERMQQAEEEHGQRLIDYLDVHWYPEVNVADEDGQDRRLTVADAFPEMVEARVQAPRSLWDSNYVENSWIGSVRGAIRLIPWLRAIVEESYPGTQLAITEWYYGGGGHISGGLAHADVLGIFGREGVGVATLWPHTNDDAFVKAAFRVYRNYDGEGAAFGDTSVHARVSDDEVLAAHASTRQDGSLVLVIINRTDEEQPLTIEIEHGPSLAAGRVFVLQGEEATLEPGPGPNRLGKNRFEVEVPELSVSVLEFEP